MSKFRCSWPVAKCLKWRGFVFFLVATLVALACTPVGQAQVSLGPEFHVNSFGGNRQGNQSVGVTAGGNFLVVWQEITPDGKHDGLWGQWFSASGEAIGANQLLQVKTPQSYGPLVAPGGHGGALVLWRETHNTNFGEWDALIGGELLPDGSWALPPRRITFLDQLLPRFASPLPRGGYVIALLGSRPHRAEDRTFLVLTDKDLKPIQGPLPVSPARYTSQEVGGLAMSPVGEFLVTWTEAETTILAQRFSPSGHPLAASFKVPSGGPDPQYGSAADALGDKGYVVAWSKNDQETGTPDLALKLLKSDGSPRSDDLRLDPEVKFRTLGAIASDPVGDFFVVWQEGGGLPDGSWDVWGRLYHPDGTAFGPKARLNQYAPNAQTNPQIAAGPNGTFVVVWQSTGQDNGDDGIYGRVFAVPAIPSTAAPQ